MYVVGVMGYDRELGRTFYAMTFNQATVQMENLLSLGQESNAEEMLLQFDDGATTVEGEQGVYFIGSLEG